VVRVRVVIDGDVQGVWYRQSCQREALALGVAGWVRNNPDGTVEAVLEGEEQPVERLLAWMRTGPPRAFVTSMKLTDETPVGEQSFSIR
jgi:acylphosphatase